MPVTLFKLIEKINIFSLKFNYQSQSKIKVKNYTIDINSRKILNDIGELKLTEREVQLILFLYEKKILKMLKLYRLKFGDKKKI